MSQKILSFLFLLALLWNGEKISKSEEEWLNVLGEKRFEVMRLKKTERAFLGEYVLTQSTGTYCCAACHLPLFSSEDKYQGGVGWPTFKKPIEKMQVYYIEDVKFGIQRYEVVCRRCDSHLGHVFHDGPPPKQLRYCINSIALKFK